MFLFGNKDRLVRALLSRARADELTVIGQLRSEAEAEPPGLEAARAPVSSWLRVGEHRPLLVRITDGKGTLSQIEKGHTGPSAIVGDRRMEGILADRLRPHYVTIGPALLANCGLRSHASAG